MLVFRMTEVGRSDSRVQQRFQRAVFAEQSSEHKSQHCSLSCHVLALLVNSGHVSCKILSRWFSRLVSILVMTLDLYSLAISKSLDN